MLQYFSLCSTLCTADQDHAGLLCFLKCFNVIQTNSYVADLSSESLFLRITSSTELGILAQQDLLRYCGFYT